ncbi:CBF-domain-containing protein [Ceraceosorus guamensis]|uniref:CBF-domain-containing protein n=1 Tax=Ceraceosorus guamensis TaxID=1522189 RepID=A0A316W7F8_9BASI|nr:CBF-domain-containing protein [Ceraceosorus guamensis]PWN44003.1 CBF-domain-containing protein [Ceraceosorus guamensis]
MASPRITKKGRVTPEVAAAASPHTSRLVALQASLSGSTDLNPLSDLLALIIELSALPDAASTLLPKSMSLLMHSVSALVRANKVPLDAFVDAEGKLQVHAHNEKDASLTFKKWISERFNESVQCFCALLGHEAEHVRLLALKYLVALQVSCSACLTHLRSKPNAHATLDAHTSLGQWASAPFRALMLVLLAGPKKSALAADVRDAFVKEYLEEYDDVRLAVCREVRTILHAIPPSLAESRLRENGTELLLHLTEIPKVVQDLNTFIVPQLQQPPPSSDAPDAKGKRKKLLASASRASKKQKVVDAGGSENESDDEAEEEDMQAWFSDSEDEEQEKTRTGNGQGVKGGPGPRRDEPEQIRAGTHTPTQGSWSSMGRKRSRRAPPFHVCVHNLAAHKAAFSAAWYAVLLPRRDEEGRIAGGSIPQHVNHQVLLRFHNQILPNLSKPRLVVDWLVDCLEAGGATSLLALNSLYTLMLSHNLQYPSFYNKLYSLLLSDPPFLHVRYRARFLRLLDNFLASSHLPEALIASFAKRMARASLRAPPAAAVSVIPFVWNLLKRHKGCLGLIHRVFNEDRFDLGPKGIEDPYDALETDPLKTGALDSSLWELAALGASLSAREKQGGGLSEGTFADEAGGQSHYLQGVTTLSHILAEPFLKDRWDLEDFLDMTYATLFESEIARTLRPTSSQDDNRARLRPQAVPALSHKLLPVAHIFPSLKAHQKIDEAAAKARKEVEELMKESVPEARQGEDDEDREAREAVWDVQRQAKIQEAERKALAADQRDVCARLWAF